MISIRKRGNVYQYCFEVGKVNGKRKQITKCDFKTKNDAYTVGQKAYDEFYQLFITKKYDKKRPSLNS